MRLPTPLRRASALVLPAALAVLAPWRGAAAQTDVEELGRAMGGAVPPPGYYETLARNPNAFQFSPDNGWIRRGRAMQERRAALRTLAAEGALFSPLAVTAQAQALAGEVHVPVFLILYKNTDSSTIVANIPRDAIDTRLYGTGAAPPYSVHTYYREISNDNMLVYGQVFDWARVSQDDTVYEGSGNGLDPTGAVDQLIREIVQYWDTLGVNFGDFDNDGPDGMPNTTDDDGFVDAVVLLHPEVGAECGAVNAGSVNNIWSHRHTYAGWTGTTLATNDSAANGGVIRVNDYIIQGAQGGDAVPLGRGGCESNRPQSMGVVAHETGHLFALPDLYDWLGGTAGIGRWGLMGSGNQQVSWRPVHMEAWSRAQLGWVTETVIASDTVLEIAPIEVSDTAYVLSLANSDQYFLLENRQRIGSDSMMIGPGLLIWHADSVLIRQRLFTNVVNGSRPHGLALEQADGLGHLQIVNCSVGPECRGDAGDPYPGTTLNHAFTWQTAPSSALNDGTPTYVNVDQIDYVGGTNHITARIRFGRPTVIQASDTLARFRLDGTEYSRFADLLVAGTDHTLDMDAVQVVNGGRNRYTWLSWSNGQPRSHTFTATGSGGSIIASVGTEYLVNVTVSGTGGGVTASPPVNVDPGDFVAAGSALRLVAEPVLADHVFEGWSGDTTAANDTLDLAVNRPYALTATFAAPLAIASDPPPAAMMGTQYLYQFAATGGVDTKIWGRRGGSLPSGLSVSIDGKLLGTPADVGSYTFVVELRSGTQIVERSFTLEVAAPALAMGNVLGQLTGVDSTLSADDLRFLDLLGNRNNRLDVGDFLAWVRFTDQPQAAAQQMVADPARREP